MSVGRSTRHGCDMIAPSMGDESSRRNPSRNRCKRDMARKIHGMTPEKEREGSKAQLARILSVSLSVVYDWLSRIDKDACIARRA